MVRIGVDTGGTFTDLVVLQDDELKVHKVRSTPSDPSDAIVQGIVEVLGEVPAADIVHGSTVATNAVLERRGAKVALVVTEGFEDVLRIGRQTRLALYDFLVRDRAPLVEPGHVFGVRERLAADGSVVVPLDLAACERLVDRLRGMRVDAVAVCLLHSYVNPAHERAIAAALRAAGLTVSCSHAVLTEYREFERWSTTAVNGYVMPLMATYLARLERRVGRARLRVMQSNGGSISAAAACQVPVRTVLSGPAAGVVGARAIAEAAGYSRIISFDMGGTSTDVSLIDQAIAMTTESTVGDFPVRLPVIDIHTVGAGGGSIAYVDGGGALRVGPRSAGADPGPVCYGKGSDLTVTDANLLLGRLDPAFFLGGRLALDVERARAVATEFAARAGLSVQALAEGIVRVANANMERALRVVSVQRGYDPREFALVAFGGAGGMHACEIAEALEIGTVLVPRHAGVLSALGMLVADVRKDYSHSILRASDTLALGELDTLFEPLVAAAVADLGAEGFDETRITLARALDVRYVGQSYELTVPFVPDYRAEFSKLHARQYGYANAARPTEVVNVRVAAVGVTPKPVLPRSRPSAGRPPLPRGSKEAVFKGRIHETALHWHEDLEAGAEGDGPALVTSAQATTVVPPGFHFRIDDLGNIVITRSAGSSEATTRATLMAEARRS